MPGVKQRVEIEEVKKRKAAGTEGLKESHLQKKLLHLWAMGKLSSTGLQELANAATADGVSQQEMVELASLGAFGQHTNNCHRDLLRLLAKKLKNSKYGGLKESPVLTITVSALDPKEENLKQKFHVTWCCHTCWCGSFSKAIQIWRQMFLVCTS